MSSKLKVLFLLLTLSPRRSFLRILNEWNALLSVYFKELVLTYFFVWYKIYYKILWWEKCNRPLEL